MIDLALYNDELDNDNFSILQNGGEVDGWKMHISQGMQYENFNSEAGDADHVHRMIIVKDGRYYRAQYTWSSWGDPSSKVEGPVELYPVIRHEWVTAEEAHELAEDRKLLPKDY